MKTKDGKIKTRRTKSRRLKETIIESLLQNVRSRGVSPSCDSCGERCSS